MTVQTFAFDSRFHGFGLGFENQRHAWHISIHCSARRRNNKPTTRTFITVPITITIIVVVVASHLVLVIYSHLPRPQSSESFRHVLLQTEEPCKNKQLTNASYQETRDSLSHDAPQSCNSLGYHRLKELGPGRELGGGGSIVAGGRTHKPANVVSKDNAAQAQHQKGIKTC